jgi:hypothetical protein
VISQNDDFGRDYLLGLKDVLAKNTIPSSQARPTKSGSDHRLADRQAEGFRR